MSTSTPATDEAPSAMASAIFFVFPPREWQVMSMLGM